MSEQTASDDRAKEREAWHAEQEAKIQIFQYKNQFTKPEDFGRGKAMVKLGRSDILRGSVQVVREGGETNLHYHTKIDSLWMVLKGRARFYGPGEVVMGEFGPHEGVLIPRGARYWFESTGEEDLELLQVSAFSEAGAEKSGRTDASPRKRPRDATLHYQAYS